MRNVDLTCRAGRRHFNPRMMTLAVTLDGRREERQRASYADGCD
jgi:hypothetical protein